MDKEDFTKIRDLLKGGGSAAGMSLIDRTRAIADMVHSNALKARENRENVVRTTFKTDDDGNSYGVGSDGNTYSYNMVNNQIRNLRPLTVEEQKYAINKFSNGNVSVNDQITNQTSLTDILKSVVRMYDKGDKLTPDKVNISDMYPDRYVFAGSPSGTAAQSNSLDAADEIEINGLSFPSLRRSIEKSANNIGWWTDKENKALGEGVITHELSHTAQNAASKILDRWRHKKIEEAEANAKKYPADKLFMQAVSRLFGNDYELGEEDTVGYKILQDAYETYDKWNNEIGRTDLGYGGVRILETAARRLGFDSVAAAADSISGYAGKRLEDTLTIDGKKEKYESVSDAEVFAEAYTDVLLNEDNAAPYSKEIIRMYKDYTEDLSKKTGWKRSDPFKEFKEMFTILPKSDFATQVRRSKNVLKNGGRK